MYAHVYAKYSRYDRKNDNHYLKKMLTIDISYKSVFLG